MGKPKRLYTWDDNTGSYILYDKQQAEIDELQAKIDRLMLEFCPDEMTQEQLSRWGECQKPVERSSTPLMDLLDKREAEIDELGDYISELENDIKEKDEEMQLLNDKIIYLLAKRRGK